jgi:hypothetical protein
LSNPVILHDPKNFVEKGIEKLWRKIVLDIYQESLRICGRLNLDDINVINSLSRKERMSTQTLAAIRDKQSFYLAQL